MGGCRYASAPAPTGPGCCRLGGFCVPRRHCSDCGDRAYGWANGGSPLSPAAASPFPTLPYRATGDGTRPSDYPAQRPGGVHCRRGCPTWQPTQRRPGGSASNAV